MNAIAVVPLLSSSPTPTNGSGSKANGDIISLPSNESSFRSLGGINHSEKSFHALMSAFTRYQNPLAGTPSPNSPSTWIESSCGSLVTLLIPNSHLTRPGDWRYDSTPLRCFDWTNGCQRLVLFDGRPDKSRAAHDRSVNVSISQDWSDLMAHRRTVSLIGVLNCKDCDNTEALLQAEKELEDWAKVYNSQSYQSSCTDDKDDDEDINPDHPPIETRLFVFDSFDESCQKRLDLTRCSMGANLVAFPPCDDTHTQMMDMHLAVVLNDLAVAIFRQTESLIRECDAVTKSGVLGRAVDRISTGLSNNNAPMGMSVAGAASLVASSNTLLSDDNETTTGVGVGAAGATRNAFKAALSSANSVARGMRSPGNAGTSPSRLLLTPVDGRPPPDYGASGKEADGARKRDVGRREKRAGDLALLAGSPLDAYARYTRAAEAAKGCHDPLWYAAAKEGCAAAFIAMADAGGHGVDDYLENNFQYPETVMTALTKDGEKKVDRTKTTLPEAVGILSLIHI